MTALLLPLLLALGAAAAPEGGYRADPSLLRSFSPEEQARTPPPFAARYDDHDRALTFIASLHGADPVTFALVQREFRRLKPQLVIIEGVFTASGENPKSWIETMRQEGLDGKMESFHAAKLAVDAGVPFIGGEPAPAQLKTMMERAGRGEEDLQGFYILRSLLGRRAEGIAETPSFEASRADYGREYGVEDPALLSFEAFKEWYARRNKKPFSYERMEQNEVWPAVGKTEIDTQNIESVMGRARDEHLLGVLADALNRHERVLAVYGAGHHVSLREALKGLLGRPVYARLKARGGKPNAGPAPQDTR